MARTSRAKKQEVPQVDIGAEIFASLRELEKIKGIPVEYMVERLKQALTNAYHKDQEDHRDIPAENVVVDLSEQGLFMYLVKTAVEEVEDPAIEIHMEAAKKLNPTVQPGDTVKLSVDIQKFGRIAAQTAKQVVIQGIREAERGAVYESFSSKTQEMLTGTVLRIDPPTGDVFIRLGQGNEQNDAVLSASEQIPGETYRSGDLVRVCVLAVNRANRGPQVQVSRTHPNLVMRLFELETPEIADGQVEIRNIAREAGSRSKMAVRSTIEELDPVGACVGPRGGRVGAVVEELGGEKIDIVVWSEDPCEYVRAALSPADVVS
ncbi:MAG: transcription termination/antitermination protein NusA, partial [Oscillospiraceae bacterium]|nr:transcription termination/antitermination protein NusA [Oscillospiraceae bacterium]